MSQGPPKRRPPKLPAGGGDGAAPPPQSEQPVAPPTPPPLSLPAKSSGSSIAKAKPTTAMEPAAPAPKTSLPPSDDDSVAEASRTRAFLDQAAGIVAVERGINAKSRVKLASIARGLGLSDAELEAAMQTLQRGEQEPTLTAEELTQLRRRQRKFHNYVGETLMSLPQGVLTASMEHMLVAGGIDEFGLSHDEAQREILDLVQKLRVRRITGAEAERNISDMADAAISPQGTLASDVRERILQEATRWGLTPDQAGPILEERIRTARLAQQTQQRRRVLLITSAAALLVAVLGTLGIMALAYAFPSNRPSENEFATPVDSGSSAAPTTGESVDNGPTTRPMVTSLPAPAWWNEDLELSVALAGARIPSYRQDLNDLRAAEEDRRSAAYSKLFANIRREEMTRDQHALLAKVLAAAYCVEPSEACAAKIRDELIETASGPRDELRESMQPWEVAIWAGDTISAALVADGLPEARGAALASAFERTFAARLERETPARLSAQVQSAVAARLYGALAVGAKSQPELAIDVHTRLLPLIDAQLDTSARDRLQSEYLSAVLPVLGERWVIYEDLIRRSVYSDDPLNVLKMLELCERTKDAGLRGYLATQLALRTGLPGTPRTMPELVAAVREALGATEAARPLDMKERAAEWRTAAAAALAKDAPAVENTRDMFQHILELARLSALGAALAQGDLGATEFDSLWREAAPSLKPAASAATTRGSTASPRLNTTQLKNLERSTTALRGYSRLAKLQRMNHMRGVKTYESVLPDVLPSQGQDIAVYLTAAKAVDEHEQVMSLVEGMLRWKMVRLAIADQLADSRLREEHLLQLVSQALRRDFTADDDNWRDTARVAILADVARELDAEASLSAETENADDQASRALVAYFRAQAKLAGVSTSDLPATALPSDLLVLLINSARDKLSSSSTPAARALVERVPHEVAAADYLTSSDLSRTAQLQRLLVALRAAELLEEKAGSAAQVSAIDAEFQERDARATHVLEQVFAGQRALLQLWLLRS